MHACKRAFIKIWWGGAAKLLQAASTAGDHQATYNLACLYDNGQGLPKDINKANEVFPPPHPPHPPTQAHCCFARAAGPIGGAWARVQRAEGLGVCSVRGVESWELGAEACATARLPPHGEDVLGGWPGAFAALEKGLGARVCVSGLVGLGFRARGCRFV